MRGSNTSPADRVRPSAVRPDSGQAIGVADPCTIGIGPSGPHAIRLVRAALGTGGVPLAVLRTDEVSTPPTANGARSLPLTAAATVVLHGKRASIPADGTGCQDEVDAACFAAACAVPGGTPAPVGAAGIGMEHAGLTCGALGGLVQVPCAERHATAAIKAIDAAHLAQRGDGQHIVSLGAVIETLRQTGRDMRLHDGVTSPGALPVNFVER